MAMAASLTGIDMNDPTNLNLYSQMLLYKDDIFREELLFKDRSSSERQILHSLADGLALEFEYSKAIRTVTISRLVDQPPLEEVLATRGSAKPEECRNLLEEEMLDSMNRELDDTLESLKSQERVAFGLNHSSPLISSASYHPVAEVGSLNHPILASKSDYLMQELAELSQSMPVAVDTAERNTLSNNPCDIHSFSFYSTEMTTSQRKTFQRSPSPAGSQSECGSGVGLRDTQPPAIYEVCQNDHNIEENTNMLAGSHSTRDRPPSWDVSYICPKCDEVFMESITFWEHYMKHTDSIVSHPHLSQPLVTDPLFDSESDAMQPYPYPPQALISDHSLKMGSCLPPPDPLTPRYMVSEVLVEIEMGSTAWHATQDGYVNQDQSRAGSCYSGSSGYKEFVFDSNSVHSGSQASAASGGSGRRGPLSGLARAGMNAVKQVGACWRCKFLRKTCNTENPCLLCPTRDFSLWASVGCHRGPFKMTSLTLCRGVQLPLSHGANISDDEVLDIAVKSLQLPSQYASMLDQETLIKSDMSNRYKPFDLQVREIYMQELARASSSVVRQPAVSGLTPLVQCILAFVWESLHSDDDRHVLNGAGVLDSTAAFDNLARLLTSAAVYQAKVESDQLIAQSLICLRACAEALRVQSAGLLAPALHRACEPLACKIACIATINMHLNLYTRELSRVTFKKDNMRRLRHWWLSAFYSFCIQSVVRTALGKLATETEVARGDRPKNVIAAHYHLDSPRRLFIAASGNFDPMISEDSWGTLKPHGDVLPQAEDFKLARKAVSHAGWGSNGIASSAIYLNDLFGEKVNPTQLELISVSPLFVRRTHYA